MKPTTLALRRASSMHWALVCIGLKDELLVQRLRAAIDTHDFEALAAMSTDVVRLAVTSGRLSDSRSRAMQSEFLRAVRAVRPSQSGAAP